jgi:hypothetical protein
MPNWSMMQQELPNSKLRNQHETTATKLELARIHLQQLSSMVPNRKITDLTPVTHNSDNSTTFDVPNLNKLIPFLTDFEAFLFTLTSSVDSFLIEINRACDLRIPDREVKIWKVREKVVKKYGKEDEFSKYIFEFFSAKWLIYLGDLRNLAAHQTIPFPILSTDMNLYLPKEPKVIEPGSIEEHIDFVAKLNELLSKTKEYLNLGFGHLHRMILK